MGVHVTFSHTLTSTLNPPLKAFLAIEQTLSMQRVRENGHEVLCIILCHVLAELIENGTVKNVCELDFPERSNPYERNSLLKQSARMVSTAFLSKNKDGMDVLSAVRQLKMLSHLTAIIVAFVTKNG